MEKEHPIVYHTARLLVAGSFITLILWYTPILELLHYFTWLTLIPLLFLVSLGVMSSSTVELFVVGAPEFRRRVEAHRVRLREENNLAKQPT